MLPYAIGLDIGISSVGWAVVGLDGEEKPFSILGMGSRIFPVAENPKTGASLALPRRESRSQRRRLRRHRHRNERIRQLLLEENIISQAQLDELFAGTLPDIYGLRVEALDRAVSNSELVRILLHIAQRRGFRSNRKGAASKEDGKLLEAVSLNSKRMEEHGYRTVAEMFLKDEAFADHKRNKGGEYITTVTRKMIEEEVHRIFDAQRSFGNSLASADLEQKYLEILLSQRSFDEGPGGNSPYGGSQILNMIGKCTFIPEELRAAKSSYSFEYFNLLEKINHIYLIDQDGAKTALSDFQRKAISEMAHQTENLTFSVIRRELKIPENLSFNLVRYNTDDANETEKKAKFSHLRAYHVFRKEFKKHGIDIKTVSKEDLNALGTVLSIYKTEEKIEKALSEAGVAEELIRIAVESGISFSKFGHLSVKACDRIIPFLEQGMIYSEACTAAGFDFRAHSKDNRTMLLHPTEDDYADITSPVAKRAIAQTIKVVNAIIRKQGCSPTYINIEVAREMAKTHDERLKSEKENDKNRAENERALDRIRNEYGKQNATGLDLIKLRLFEQQDGVCAYSIKQISAEHLFDPNYVEIDHIIPYSISFDDRMSNKVLVFTKENREKGNRLPLEYLTGKQREDFLVWVESRVRDSRKKKNLLKESITEEERQQFRERNLQDTKTMSRFLLNFINDRLLFAESTRGRKKCVTAVNGATTAYMRKRWVISKVREEGDQHHAVDALVIACITDGLIRRVSYYSKYKECEYLQLENSAAAVDPDTGEILTQFPYPWQKFHVDLECWKSQIFVSRMPNRKVTGAAHKETAKSPKALEERLLVSRVPLTSLRLGNSGEIENYYQPEKDISLYEGLKARLREFGNDPKKAFAEPFEKPGNPGRIVKKVQVFEKSTISVPVLGGNGRADNGSMVRVDVFKKEDGYYLIPVYTSDVLKPELPNRAVVAHKPYEQWQEMKDEDFIFSLYPNDLIRVVHKKGISLKRKTKESNLPEKITQQEFLLYYTGTDIAAGAFSCVSHDGAYLITGLGAKTLEVLEKYSVDVLGDIHKVEHEPRLGFGRKN